MLRLTKYNVVLTMRDRILVFWTLAFPIILGIMFKFALGGIDESFSFEPISVAVVEEKESSGEYPFTNVIDELKGDMLKPQYIDDRSEAQKLLSNGEIKGMYLINGEDISLVVAGNDMNGSILKAILDTYEQQTAIINDIVDEKVEKLKADIETEVDAENYDGILELKTDFENEIRRITESIEGEGSFVKNADLGGRDVSAITPYFYALIAMACMYMSFLGETVSKRTQANISPIGIRVTLSPVHRFKLILSNAMSAYIVSVINIAIILIVLDPVMGVIDISYHPFYAIVTCLMGCLIGVSFGVFIQSIGKWGEGIKTAVLLGTSMACSFLSGLMVGNMKDIIEKNVPILNKINPAALISDSFYSICVYDDLSRLRMNLVLMGVISIIFLTAAWLLTRRVSYDSI